MGGIHHPEMMFWVWVPTLITVIMVIMVAIFTNPKNSNNSPDMADLFRLVYYFYYDCCLSRYFDNFDAFQECQQAITESTVQELEVVGS